MMLRSMTRALAVAAGACLIVSACATASFGYQQANDKRGVLPCEACHTSWSGGSDPGHPGSGPHGLYTAASHKCSLCHSVHDAVGGSLLPSATIEGSCFTCHDATGGYAVYGEVLARTGEQPAAAHSVDETSVVPGGGDLGAKLTCTSCHAIHGNTAMQPFPQMKQFAAEVGWPTPSNRLLRDDPGGKPRGSVTVYGGAWCAACHDQRMGSDSEVANHPTSESTAVTGVYGGDTYPDLFPSEFVMEDTTPTPPGRHAPYCQQCHWNSVDVEAAISLGYFDYDYSRPDLTQTVPGAASFPHETQYPRMRIELGDDLCLNCHSPARLP